MAPVRSGPGVGQQRVGDLEERLARRAADLLDHLRRVALEVLLEDLEDAALVLQRRVLLGGAARPACRPGALNDCRPAVAAAASAARRFGVVAPFLDVVACASPASKPENRPRRRRPRCP